MRDEAEWVNKLYFGDNLSIMRENLQDESVDLIYLDPPFNSKATYNVLFAEKDGTQSRAQITAFEDSWHWGEESQSAYERLIQRSDKLSDLIEALYRFLGSNDMMAYLIMMAERLAELRGLLKPTGSLYLHCDPTASHYMKLILDSIFGPKSFRNEIIWKRTPFSGSSKARAKQLPKSHDVIFFYSKGNQWTWNAPTVPYSEKYLKRFKWSDDRGCYRKTLLKTYSEKTLEFLKKENRLIEPERPGAQYSYKQYLDESSGERQLDDIWTDINMINPVARERLGYPTQKPESLLERIIGASSNEGDVILDPFCGCGTTISVAERLKRRWIGIDITYLAISLMKTRLSDTFPDDLAPFEIIGDPKDLSGARALAAENRFQFEWWAVGKVGAYPAQDKRKGPDSGIDGIIKFFDDKSGKPKRIIVQVKSGKVHVSHVRDLIGVVKREKAEIGVFITSFLPTDPMKVEAVKEGFYAPKHFPKEKFPRIQILSVEDILAGRTIQYPRLADATFKKAQRRYKEELEQDELL